MPKWLIRNIVDLTELRLGAVPNYISTYLFWRINDDRIAENLLNFVFVSILIVRLISYNKEIYLESNIEKYIDVLVFEKIRFDLISFFAGSLDVVSTRRYLIYLEFGIIRSEAATERGKKSFASEKYERN